MATKLSIGSPSNQNGSVAQSAQSTARRAWCAAWYAYQHAPRGVNDFWDIMKGADPIGVSCKQKATAREICSALNTVAKCNGAADE